MTPSLGDLQHYNCVSKKFKIKPIFHGIGRYINREIDLLLFQQIPSILPDNELSQCSQDIEGNCGKSVLDLMEDTTIYISRYGIPPGKIQMEDTLTTIYKNVYPYIVATHMRNTGLYKADVVRIDENGVRPEDFPRIEQFACTFRRMKSL